MKKHFLTFALGALAATGIANGQTPATTQTAPASQTNSGVAANRVVGEVTGINQTEGAITLKADGGSQIIVLINDKTMYYRAKPDALARAGTAAITPADMLKATLAEVGMGDRVVVLGKLATDQKSVPARVLIIATKADIAQKHELDREQWRRRGILGTVTAVNTDTKEITLATSATREAAQPIVVAAGDAKVRFRRYAPDSVKFADARMSKFADLKVGDRLRALGERSADGARFMPEEIVSGSFRQLVGTVVSVDAATNEIKLLGQDKKPLTIVVSNDSNLRRLPPMMAQFMAQRAAGGGGGMMGGGGRGAGGNNNGGGAGRPEGGGASAGGTGRPPQAGGDPGAAGMGGGGRRGGFDPQDMLERMPQITLAELKPGEMIIVSSTAGADPARLTAMALVAGVDALVNAAPPARTGRPNGAGGQDLGLPGGIDIGIGLP